MPNKITQTALLLACALFAVSTSAIAAEDGSKLPTKKQPTAGRTATPPAGQCEEGRSWCAKQAACIKTGTPCRYLKNDPAF